MKIKLTTLVFGLVMVVSAVLVYAWVFDSDGGFNRWVKGTCSDPYGSYTDFCFNDAVLVEYYPDPTNETCSFSRVICVPGTGCVDGACVWE